MNTYQNFRAFYDAKLLPDLKILDKERKQVDHRVLLIGAIALVLIIVIGRLFRGSGVGYFQILVGVFAFVAITAVSKKYRSSFKNKIVQKITAFARFKAKMYFTTMGAVDELSIDVSNASYRYKFGKNGQKGLIITKIRQDETNPDFSGRVP